MDNKKVLVVLDDTIMEERTGDDFDLMISFIKESLSSMNFIVDIELKTIFTEFVYDISPSQIMNEIDSESSKLFTEDYEFVISEGLSSYFWLHSMISVPMISINPVEDPQKSFWTFITDEISEEFDEIDEDRVMHSSDAVCILTNDSYALDLDGAGFNEKHIIMSNDKITDKSFWQSEELKQAINIVYKDCIEE